MIGTQANLDFETNECFRFLAGEAVPTSKTKKYVRVIIKLNFCLL